MKKYVGVGLMGLVLLSSMSCKEDPEVPVVPEPTHSVKIDVQPVFNGNDLMIDSTYTTAEGHNVQFTNIKFYFEDVRNGANQLTEAMLFDYVARGTQLYDGAGKASDFSSLEANLGVSGSNNNSDPAAFSNGSWLNITKANDMHWGWNTGYIFVKVEARVDTIPDGVDLFDQFVVFHAGKNENLETISFSNLNWVSIGTNSHQLSMELDMSEFLQSAVHTIDLQFENSSHSAPGQETMTTKVMENFKEALLP
jgi:hypothetical protein